MNKQNEIAEKINRISQMLTAEKLGGVLLNAQHNFAWLTAGGNNAVDTSRENGAASILIRRDGKKFLLASRIEMPRMLAEEVSAEDFEPLEFAWEDEKSSSEYLLNLAKSVLEKDADFATDIFFSPNFRTVENKIAQCRYSLTEAEKERFRLLGKDAAEVFSKLPKILQLGETEKEIAGKVRNELALRDINSVVTLVAADERIAKFRHPVPTENIWKQTLLVAVCARRGGLTASLSRIYNFGKISDELRRRTDATAKVHAKLVSATQPGKSGAELYRIAAESYRTEGFEGEENLHHQGGACGYRTRDWVAHPNCAETVQLNQAFAWNPSITGTKTEETFIVSENGIEMLTTSPDFPYLSTIIDGREYLSPDILSL